MCHHFRVSCGEGDWLDGVGSNFVAVPVGAKRRREPSAAGAASFAAAYSVVVGSGWRVLYFFNIHKSPRHIARGVCMYGASSSPAQAGGVCMYVLTSPERVEVGFETSTA